MAAEKSIFFAFIASIISAAIILGGCTKINKKVEKAYESEKTGYNSVVSLSRSVSDIWLLAGGKLKGTTYDAMDLDGISEDTVSIGSPLSPSTEADFSRRILFIILPSCVGISCLFFRAT